MPLIIVERTFDRPHSDEDFTAGGTRESSCRTIYGVKLRRTVEIATEVASGAHAVLMVDQAGWRLSPRLIAPANITLIRLPPKCPKLTCGDSDQGNSCSRRHDFMLWKRFQIQGQSHST
jgi:hypothetical protein